MASTSRPPAKVTWAERNAWAVERFPYIPELDWHDALRDFNVLGPMLRDIKRADIGREGRGVRPDLRPEEHGLVVHQLSGQDYSTLPFHQAFQALKGTRSIRHVAGRCGLPPARAQRLLRGDGPGSSPTLDDMATIARAFGKEPWYFVEFRVEAVSAWVATQLSTSPETSAMWFDKLGLAAPPEEPRRRRSAVLDRFG